MEKDDLQDKFLATSTVSQNVLGLFSAANHIKDPQKYANSRKALREVAWECQDHIGQLKVMQIELTQAHKDVMEMLFKHFPYKNDAVVEGYTEYLIRFSFDKLLRRLGKASNPNNYCWLLNVLSDLRDVSITLTLVDTHKNSDGKVRYQQNFFGILNEIQISGEIYPSFRTKERVEKFLATKPSFADCAIRFSRQFSSLLKTDILLQYDSLVDEIVTLPQGFMKALVRHCYGHEWKKNLSFDDLLLKYLQFHIEANPRTLQVELCNARKFFKPSTDGSESKWTTHFRQVFGIDLHWNNKKLFVSWSKQNFDLMTKNMEGVETKVRRISQQNYIPKEFNSHKTPLKRRPITKKQSVEKPKIMDEQKLKRYEELKVADEKYKLSVNELCELRVLGDELGFQPLKKVF